MRTPDTSTGDTAALVRQTLQTVASALPVEARELPPDARHPFVITQDDAAGHGGGPRRPSRRAALAVAAAVLVSTAGVLAVQLNDDSTATEGDDPAGRPAMEDPADGPTLCGARPGNPALPGEAAGQRTDGAIGVSGTDDIPYELLLWQDRVTSGDAERSGDCWRLTIEGGPPLRGGGDVVTPAWPPATTLVAVVWTDDETVFWAAHEPGVMFTADADLVSTPLDARSDDGTAFTFLRVARDGRAEVTFDMIDTAGRRLGTAGPLPLDQPTDG
jgi:hypothetical protein